MMRGQPSLAQPTPPTGGLELVKHLYICSEKKTAKENAATDVGRQDQTLLVHLIDNIAMGNDVESIQQVIALFQVLINSSLHKQGIKDRKGRHHILFSRLRKKTSIYIHWWSCLILQLKVI